MTLENKKQRVFDYIHNIVTQNKDKYPEFLLEQKELDIANRLWNQFSDCQYEEITEIIDNAWKDKLSKSHKIKQHFTASEKVAVNEFLYYAITDNVLHFHILPPSVKDDISKFGSAREYINYLAQPNGILDDGFSKIAQDIKDKNLNVDLIFAVSPTLTKRTMQTVFEPRGFECEFDEQEDFKEMFPNSVRRGIVKMPVKSFLKSYENQNASLQESSYIMDKN